MSRSICRFWQQGYCKYGSSCRFDHSGQSGQQSNNRFNAPSAGPSNITGGGRSGDLPYHLSREVIHKDLTEEQPTWILSAYGPGKDAPEQLFGGYPREQSFEEIRLHYFQGALSGNAQGAKNDIDNLYHSSRQQIQTILSDLDGAIKYILDAGKRHPNRIDTCERSSRPGGTTGEFGLDRQRLANNGNTFGASANSFQSSAPKNFGTASSQTPTSSFGQASAFGSQPNPFTTLGQASQAAGAAAPGKSAFGQPPQMSNAFGQPSALGAKPNPFGAPAFGQSAQSTGGTAFGQTSQAAGTFGQPSLLGTTPTQFPASTASASPFPSLDGAKGATPSNPFVQATQSQNSSLFGNLATATMPNKPFGQSANPGFFGQQLPVNSSPFRHPQPQQQEQQQSSNPFAAPNSSFTTYRPFSDQAPTSTASPFATGQSNGPGSTLIRQGVSSGFGQSAQQPPPPSLEAANTFAVAGAQSQGQGQGQGPYGPNSSRQHPQVESYTSKGSDGLLRMFKGKAVSYLAPRGSTGDGEKIPVVRNFDGSVTKIWFPDGPPTYTPDTEAVDGNKSDDDRTVTQWRMFVERGGFANSVMPEVPPMREWCAWDF